MLPVIVAGLLFGPFIGGASYANKDLADAIFKQTTGQVAPSNAERVVLDNCAAMARTGGSNPFCKSKGF
jgi:hypothetical protein